MGGLDVIETGDFKQEPPIGDDPLYVEGLYAGRARDGAAGEGQVSQSSLVGSVVSLRDEFQDVAILQQAHRLDDGDDTMAAEAREAYRAEADRYQEVMLRLADCTWTVEDHAWLAQRSRRRLQATAAGREELRRFEDAPLLMDTRKRRATASGGGSPGMADDGADRMNALELRRLPVQRGVAIARIKGFHDRESGAERLETERLDDQEFKGLRAVVELCVGARVLLTRNLWTEAGLMNGAVGYVRGFMWPVGGDPASADSRLRSPLCVLVEFEEVNRLSLIHI